MKSEVEEVVVGEPPLHTASAVPGTTPRPHTSHSTTLRRFWLLLEIRKQRSGTDPDPPHTQMIGLFELPFIDVGNPAGQAMFFDPGGGESWKHAQSQGSCTAASGVMSVPVGFAKAEENTTERSIAAQVELSAKIKKVRPCILGT